MGTSQSHWWWSIFAVSPHENKQCTYFVSASGSLLEFNVLSIVVQREDGSHVSNGKDFASGKLEELRNAIGWWLDWRLGVYSSENRRIIACLNAMGKIVFNDNQRWVELNYKPQHLPSRLKRWIMAMGMPFRKEENARNQRNLLQEGSNRKTT